MSMQRLYVLLAAGALTAGTIVAQAPSLSGRAAAPAPDAKADEDAPARASVPEPAPQKPLEGDTLTLKDGNVISGVQIIRESPKEYVVEVIQGVTLAIPRGQVTSVTRDNITSLDLKKRRAKEATAADSGLIQGKEFANKLSIDISKPAKDYTNEDLESVLSDLGMRAGIEVVCDESVKALPAKKRQWTYKLDGERSVTLFNLLKDELPRQWPDLDVVYLNEQVVVATRDAAQALKEKGAIPIPGPEDVATPPASDTPPAGPPAPSGDTPPQPTPGMMRLGVPPGTPLPAPPVFTVPPPPPGQN